MNTTIQHLLFFFLMMPLNLVNQNLGCPLAFFKGWLALSWYSAKISSSSRSTDWTKTRLLRLRVGQSDWKLVRFVRGLDGLPKNSFTSSETQTGRLKTGLLRLRVGQLDWKLMCSVLKRFVKYLFDLLMLFLLTSSPFWARKTVNHFFDLLFCNLLYYCFYLII